MKKRFRLRALLIFALAGLAGALLLNTSQNVQTAEDKIAGLKDSIESQKQSIRALKAEWAYLNNPARIEKLAQRRLGMIQPAPDSIAADASRIPPAQESASPQTEAP